MGKKITTSIRKDLQEMIKKIGLCETWSEALNDSSTMEGFLWRIDQAGREILIEQKKAENQVRQYEVHIEELNDEIEENRLGVLSELMQEAGVKLNPDWHFDRVKLVEAIRKCSEINPLTYG